MNTVTPRTAGTKCVAPTCEQNIQVLTARQLRAIQRKLDRWELEHLREHAAALDVRLEAALAEIDELKRQRDWADDCAQMHQNLNNQLMERMDATVGLTKAGDLVVLEGAPA